MGALPSGITCLPSRMLLGQNVVRLNYFLAFVSNSHLPLVSLTTFFKSAAKIKIKRAFPRRRSFYNITFTITKNKSYFIKLVYKTVK